MPSVLVLDADMPSALAVIRSLGRRGLTVHVAAAVENTLAGRSRYVRQRRVYPDPLTQADAFLSWLDEQSNAAGHALIISLTERTLVPMSRARDRLACAERCAMPPMDALEAVLDKDRTVALARQHDVTVPSGVTVTTAAELAAAAPAQDWPVVLKPARSISEGDGQGSRQQLAVTYARNREEYDRLGSELLGHGPLIVQEYFKGHGVGVEVIADHGEVRYAFQHRRLHEVPLTGGGSSLRISDPVAPELLAASERLMRALAWHGVAMVEFRVSADGSDYRLMEINGRFWGSLPLATAAGADFPGMLWELYREGRVGAHPPAKTGVRCRKLSADLYWLECNLRRIDPHGLYRFPERSALLKEALSFLSPRVRLDVQSLRDPRPGLADLAVIARDQLGRIAGILRERRAARRAERAFASVRSQLDAKRGAGEKARVVFLCYGNINRSALAEAIARREGVAPERLASAGFHEVAGRPADPVMVSVAAGLGADLEGWSSRTVKESLLKDVDAVLVMEVAHRERLLARFPALAERTTLLGFFGGESTAGDATIDDPYGHPRAAYEAAAAKVERAVRGLVSQL